MKPFFDVFWGGAGSPVNHSVCVQLCVILFNEFRGYFVSVGDALLSLLGRSLSLLRMLTSVSSVTAAPVEQKKAPVKHVSEPLVSELLLCSISF